ncbi:hypothetical protein OS493_025356 [Desmophyllum pertusum]|uniref:F5/8 type C domain-containing protein n=1 Tax=Desmophyllum pertusum TaxID=174260 RepID=A0A9X0CPP0_9CNID|nr:hypothetical protein OS493_025356 [Desmophyllum pertusum]
MWQVSDDFYIKLSIATQQPLIPGDWQFFTWTVEIQAPNKKDIQALTMAFRLPYFLVYQNKTATVESVKPSSVSTHTGQPVLQFTSLKKSENISLDMRLLVMRQDLVSSGSESTSAGHVDISYRRGSEECSQTYNTYRNVEILVYNPDCKNFGPLGIRKGGIKESQLSVSSQFQTHHYKAGNGPYLSGLHSLKEYWAPAAGLPSYDRRQYVQISAQGHPEAKAPIKSLQIRVSNDGYRWKDYSGTNVKFYVTTGAPEDVLLLTALLKMPLITRWLRISPRFSDGLIGFRFEVYGCSSEKPFFSFEDPPLGMESGQITDNQTSSSSYFDDYTTATKARLNLQELTGGMVRHNPMNIQSGLQWT